jgi:DNA-binding NtrC family response regulator
MKSQFRYSEGITSYDRTATQDGNAASQIPSGTMPTLRSLRTAAEIRAISIALLETRWNRKRAAQLLSISYRGLLYKIRQHNITPEFVDQVASGVQSCGR